MATETSLDLNVQQCADQADRSSESVSPVVRRITKKKVRSNDESFDDDQFDLLIGVDKSNTTAGAASVDKLDSDNRLTLKKFKTMLHFDSDVEEADTQNDSSYVQSMNSESDRSSHSASGGEDYDSDSSVEFIGTYRPPCPVHESIATVECKGIDIEVNKEKEKNKSNFKTDATKRKAIELSASSDVHFENSSDASELEFNREPETNKKPKIAFKVIKGSRKGNK